MLRAVFYRKTSIQYKLSSVFFLLMNRKSELEKWFDLWPSVSFAFAKGSLILVTCTPTTHQISWSLFDFFIFVLKRWLDLLTFWAAGRNFFSGWVLLQMQCNSKQLYSNKLFYSNKCQFFSKCIAIAFSINFKEPFSWGSSGRLDWDKMNFGLGY